MRGWQNYEHGRKAKMTKMTNREFSTTSDQFQEACLEAGVKVTKRQASKFRRGTGLAFKMLPANIRKEVRNNVETKNAAD